MRHLSLVLSAIFLAGAPPAFAREGRTPLATGWSVQSSARVVEKGDAISVVGYKAAGWHSAKVPNT